MKLDYLDPRLGLPLAAALWLIVIVILVREHVADKIDAYFANRRHIRREKRRRFEEYVSTFSYTKEDLAAMRKNYNPNRPPRKSLR